MTREESHRKRLWLWIGCLYFTAGYFGASALGEGRAVPVPFIFAWERDLPFLPRAILAYALIYPGLIAAYLRIDDYRVIQRLIPAYLLLTGIHFAIFALMPVEAQRPMLPENGSVWVDITRFFYLLDPPRNLFPSLHISQPLLIGLLMWRQYRLWSVFLLGLTAILSVAVLLVKQHYAIDVLAAYTVTAGVVLVSGWWMQRRTLA